MTVESSELQIQTRICALATVMRACACVHIPELESQEIYPPVRFNTAKDVL